MKYAKLYSYLMSEGAFVLCRFTNDAAQEVILVEHPIYGDDAGILVMFPKYAVAFETDFFDIDDLAESKEYQPLYIDEDLKFAYEVN
jgi:hypothetical protein